MKNELSNSDAIRIINIAKAIFLKGEQWGITYSTWFDPEQEQHEEKFRECLEEVLKVSGLPHHITQQIMQLSKIQ